MSVAAQATRLRVLLGIAAFFGLLSQASAQHGSPVEGPVRIGLSEARLDPSPGFEMWGYGPRPNGGELDPLMARVLLVEGDAQRIALVTLDLGRTPAGPQMDRVRERVRREAGVDDVLFTASHTHSGPYLRDEYENGVPVWESAAMERIADAIVRAAGDTFEARLGVGYGRAEIGFNRRYVLPDGTVRMMWANPTRVSTYPVDPEVTVLRIDDAQGRVRALVVGYSCHPVVFGPDNLDYSADFPGAMAEHIAAQHPDSPLTLFVQGAPGDINPFLDKRELPADAVRLMREVGVELADEVLRTSSGIETSPSPAPTLELRREEWRWHHRLDRDDRYAGDLTVLLIDDTIGLVGLPGEPFVEFQLDIKRRRPVPHVLFAGYTNGYVGYFPTIRAAAEGGYGADPTVARVELGAGERMMMKAYRYLLEMSGRLRERPER